MAPSLTRQAYDYLTLIIKEAERARHLETTEVEKGMRMAREQYQRVWGLQRKFRKIYGEVLPQDPYLAQIEGLLAAHPRDILGYMQEHRALKSILFQNNS